jgi:DNA-binding NtrC family response regulator
MPTAKRYVVVLSRAAIDRKMLSRVADSFGWDVLNLSRLQDLNAVDTGRIAAVIFDRQTAGCDWLHAAAALRAAAPGARLIAGHSFSESIDWPELCDAGVFHAIRLPLSESELFQSLGYVWAQEQARPAAAFHRPPTVRAA